jgi:hypothetical protein
MYMFPCSYSLNAPYGGLGYAELSGDVALISGITENGIGFLFRELAHTVTFTLHAAWWNYSTLFNSIIGVVSVSSQEQMVWVYTGWVVTMVKHAQTIRYCSPPKFP